jgi:putative hydrolase of the HAD superfamily
VSDSAPIFPRAVLFDYFGTLTRAVRQGPSHRQMARRLGCDPDAWLALMAATFYLRASGRLGDPTEVLGLLARHLGAAPAYWTLRIVRAQRIAAIAADAPLRPQAVPVLRGLRERGLRTAVISDCWYELPALLPHLPIHPLLDASVYSVDVGWCKPHPAMYLAACERLGVTLRECLYVGDGGSRELSGAQALGMWAVQLAAPDLAEHLSYAPDEDFRGPSIASLDALLPLLDGQPPYRDGDNGSNRGGEGSHRDGGPRAPRQWRSCPPGRENRSLIAF